MSLKAKVIAVAKKNPWFREFCRGAVHIAGTAGYFFLKIFHPVDKKLVVFASFQGRSYACSPRRIYEVLRDGEQYRDYRFIWAFDKPERHAELAREPRTQVVRYGSLSYYRAYAGRVTGYRTPACPNTSSPKEPGLSANLAWNPFETPGIRY